MTCSISIPFSFRFFVIGALCFTSFNNVVRSKNLLLIGDSVDRLIVVAWCSKHGIHKVPTNWGDNVMKYGRKNKKPTSVCNNTKGDSIASLHIFGSSNGPYLWVDHDNSTGTANRIQLALRLYSQQIGKVDQIIFNAVLWDIRPQFVMGDNNTRDHKVAAPFVQTLQTMETNVRSRLDELVKTVGSGVDVGIRNAPYSPGYETKGIGQLYHNYNQMMRKIAREKRITFYDYDFDLWSPVKFDYDKQKELFVDISHPRSSHNRAAGEKMLGHKYSRFYQNEISLRKDNRCSFGRNSSTNDSFAYILNECPNLSISLLQVTADKDIDTELNSPDDLNYHQYYMNNKCEVGKLYYTNIMNGTRYIWNNLSEQFLVRRSLGSADIFRIPAHALSNLVFLGSSFLLPHKKSEESSIKFVY